MRPAQKNFGFLAGSIGIVAILAAVIVFGFRLGPLATAEQLVDDVGVAHFTANAPEPHKKVAVVAIDDRTVEAYPPRSPINRAFLARLVETLAAAQPKVIGLDVLLAEPTSPDRDRRLRDALRQSQVPIVAATGLQGGKPLPLAPGFAETGIHTAIANLPIDRDSEVVRSFRTGFTIDGEYRASLAARLAEIATGRSIPPREEAQAIDWYGRPGVEAAGEPPIPTFAAHILLDVPAAAALLRDRIVLVGATFTGAPDRVKTPFSRVTPEAQGLAGVKVHAQVTAQLIDARTRPQSDPAVTWALVIISLLCAFLVTLKRPPVLAAVGLAFVVPLAWIVATLWLRGAGDVPLAALPPAVAFGLGVGVFSAYQARRLDDRQRRALRALARRVPPGVVDELLAAPDLIRTGGESRMITVLFTDLVGFTAFSETRPASEVMALLGEHIEMVSERVLAYGGTLDKFIGDSVMAFWGAPLSQPDHAERALACALDIDRLANEAESACGLVTRIGLHSGEAVVGFLGGRERLEYTAIGDTVNTASRIEGANKFFGTRVCLSSASTTNLRNLDPGAGLRRVGAVRLSGRSAPVDLYTPAPHDHGSELLEQYEQALQHLESGNFREAEKLFIMLPEDGLVRFQLDRCQKRTNDAIDLGAK